VSWWLVIWLSRPAAPSLRLGGPLVSCLCTPRRCFPQVRLGIKAARSNAKDRLLLFSISVLFCSVLFCSVLFCRPFCGMLAHPGMGSFSGMLAQEWGLSVGCWPRKGAFQWDAGPGMGSFCVLPVECWPRNGVFQWNAGQGMGSFSGMLAKEWGLSVECWPRNGVLLVLTVLGAKPISS
jgi:hypothetical protein